MSGIVESFQRNEVTNQGNAYKTIEISVSARNLKNVDVLSKSDPVCYLCVKEDDGEWRQFGCTEPIMNDLNPDFVKKFNVCYMHDKVQYLKFKLYDVDEKVKDCIKISDFLGEYTCPLTKLVSCLKIDAPLSSETKKVKGNIIVVAEKQEDNKEEIHMVIQAENVVEKRKSGKRSLYLKISKEGDDKGFVVVYRTETKNKENSPKWMFCLKSSLLCNGEQERWLKFEVFDDKKGNDKLLGCTKTTLRDLKTCNTPISFTLKPKLDSSESEEHGILKVLSFAKQMQNTFDDFVSGITKLKMTIGIDFSITNGLPNLPSSLHHCIPGGANNQYARAIQAVVEILQVYLHEKSFSTYAFTIKNRATGQLESVYPLNGNKDSPNCKGADDILSYYYECLQTVDLGAPCEFAPLIEDIISKASKRMDGREYHILVIFTDGNLDDMAETKKKIIEASSLPISIVIIGIGSGDFTAMKMLDSDGKLLTIRRAEAARDIVQFVAFRDFDPKCMGAGNVKNYESLAKEVMQEIPDQLLGYMRSKGIDVGRSNRHSTLV